MEHTFRRDPTSNALINIDAEGLEAYKKHKKDTLQGESIARDINTLKSEFEEIKVLLTKLINKE